MVKIFYRSNYGTTKQYAQWLAEQLKCQCVDAKNAKAKELETCDTLIFGAGIYAGSIKGISYISKNFSLLKNKKIIIFTVGLSSKNDGLADSAFNKAFTKEEQKQIAFFHLHGNANYAQLNGRHKLLINMLQKMLSQKPESDLTEIDRKMLKLADTPIELINKSEIEPIIKYVTAYM